MNRALLSLALVSGVLAAGVGVGELANPAGGRPANEAGNRRVPVQSTVVACPDATSDGVSESTVAVASPSAPAAAGATGAALVTTLAKPGQVRQRLTQPGQVAAVNAGGAVVARATGSLAPGLSLQQTTTTETGVARGLSSSVCAQPGSDFWFAGTSTVTARRSALYLTNSEQVPASVDLYLYGRGGLIDTPGGRGLTIGPGQQRTILLAVLAPNAQDLAVDVVVRTGRVAAALRDQEVSRNVGRGVDWLPAAAPAAKRTVVPAAPGGGTQRLYLLAPGDADGTARIRLVGKDGPFVPVGAERVPLTAGKLVAVDLTKSSRGEPVAVDVDADVPVVAGLRVVRGGTGKQASAQVTEVGYLAGVEPIVGGAVVPDSRGGPKTSSPLYLTAPGRAARVSVQTLGGGTPQTRTLTVPGGTTVEVTPRPATAKASRYAVVVTPEPGGGPVYGSWALSVRVTGGELFTLAPLADDHATVRVPRVGHDLSAGISRVR